MDNGEKNNNKEVALPPSNLPQGTDAPEFSPLNKRVDPIVPPSKPPVEIQKSPIPNLAPKKESPTPITSPKTINEKPLKKETEPTVEKSAKNPSTEKSFSSLRTYENDIAKILRNKNVSVVDIKQAETKKQQNPQKESPYVIPEKKRFHINWNVVFVVLLSILLVSILFVVVNAFIFTQETEPLPTSVASGTENPEVEAFFLVNQKIPLAIDDKNKNALIQSIEDLREGTIGPLGTVTQIYFTEKADLGLRVLGFDEMLSIFSLEPPPSLIRSLNKDFIYGMHVFEGNQPFLALRVESYGRAFAGMLEWETSLERDMKGLLIQDTNQEGAASTTAQILKKHAFKDKVVLNRDTRGMYDERGELILLYTFINTDTLILTTHEGTLKEITERLERIRFSR